MKKYSKMLFYAFSFVCLISSCVTIKKRHYNKGFVFEFRNKSNSPIEVTPFKKAGSFKQSRESEIPPNKIGQLALPEFGIESSVAERRSMIVAVKPFSLQQSECFVKRSKKVAPVLLGTKNVILDLIPIADTSTKKIENTGSISKIEPIGKWGFWLIVASISTILLIVLCALMVSPANVLFIIGMIRVLWIIRQVTLFAGFILTLIGLFRIAGRGKKYKRKGLVITAFLIALFFMIIEFIRAILSIGAINIDIF